MTTDPQTNINYKRLRRFMGSMGFALPIILLVGSLAQCNCGHLQDTISAYYYTQFISVFCGIIFTIAIFLFTYTHPDRIDRISTNIAGVFAIGVAIFPTAFDPADKDACNTLIETWWCGTNLIHTLSAGGFFLTVAFISYFVFTQTHKTREEGITTNAKLFRNRIYKACGIIILVCTIASGICNLKIKEINAACPHLKPVFILETIMLFAFGTAWLVKGETVFADESETYNRLPNFLKPKQQMPKS